MNYEETRKAIEVMEAYLAGEAIEYRYGISPWYDREDGEEWDFTYYEYRVKPKPKYKGMTGAEILMHCDKMGLHKYDVIGQVLEQWAKENAE